MNSSQLAAEHARRQQALGEADARAEIAIDEARKMGTPTYKTLRCWHCVNGSVPNWLRKRDEPMRCGICSGSGLLQYEVRE